MVNAEELNEIIEIINLCRDAAIDRRPGNGCESDYDIEYTARKIRRALIKRYDPLHEHKKRKIPCSHIDDIYKFK